MSGKIVAVQALSHTAFVNTHRAEAGQEQAERFFRACRVAAERLRAAAPDVVIMIGTDHFNNYGPADVPAISIGTAAAHAGPFPSEAALAAPRTQQGAGRIADDLVRDLLGAGLPVSRSTQLALDHSLLVPLGLLEIDHSLPVIPIYQNCVAEPLLSLAGAWKFGETMASVVAAWKSDLRIAIVGTGGLSHWVGTPEQGSINQDWDQELLALCEQGRLAECVEWSDEQVREEAGNGAHELRNWLAAWGTVGAAPADVLSYEPIAPWLTGMAVVDARL